MREVSRLPAHHSDPIGLRLLASAPFRSRHVQSTHFPSFMYGKSSSVRIPSGPFMSGRINSLLVLSCQIPSGPFLSVPIRSAPFIFPLDHLRRRAFRRRGKFRYRFSRCLTPRPGLKCHSLECDFVIFLLVVRELRNVNSQLAP